jgi:uncharacterized protein (DUF1501 family)
MLSITSPHGRFGRREFLGIGGLALAGLPGMGWAADATSARLTTDRSVIFLFLHGGPSQFETFDPKMSAPAEIRSATGAVQTAIPGVTFGGSFPKLAKLANRVSVVRSFMTGDANHDIKPIVCRDTFGANIGSMYSHVAGGNDPANGMPLNVALFPRAVDSNAQPHQAGFGNFLATGAFGAASAPFVPGGAGPMQKNLHLSLPLDRLDDRRALLRGIDQMKASLDDAERAGLDGIRERAIQVLLGDAASAFDLSREPAKTVEMYDTARVVRVENIDKKWNNHKFYVDNAKTLGKLMLLARRLCERGCRFVTVTTNFVWDMHSDVNNAPMIEGMGYAGTPLDHALSTFLTDVESRGLSDKILLVVCGEMGRSPRINGKGGRDHWGNLAPLLLAGGGLPMGRVIGQSTSNGGEPASEPVTNRHLVSTIMHTLFDIGRLRVQRGLPRELQQVTEWSPIPGLGM